MSAPGTILICLITVVAVSAQTASTPVAGMVVDSNGSLFAISGVLGTLLPGVPVATGNQPVRSAAFGAANGAVKTDSRVLVIDLSGSVLSANTAAPGPATWGFAVDGALQWMYIAGSPEIQSLTGAASIASRPLGDEVIALGATGAGGLQVLARTGSQLWSETVDVVSGAVTRQSPVPGKSPAIAFEGGWLVTSGTGLLWVGPGAAAPLAIASSSAVLTLQTAGPHSVAVNGQWLLNRAWTLLEIPGVVRTLPRTALPPVGRSRQ